MIREAITKMNHYLDKNKPFKIGPLILKQTVI